jgi:hypothetical protein
LAVERAERQSRANSVQAEIAHYWGGSQRILGPYLIVPYTVKTQRLVDGKALEMEVTRQAIFLPDTLNVSGNVQTEMRRRSIYDVTVYQGKLALAANTAGRISVSLSPRRRPQSGGRMRSSRSASKTFPGSRTMCNFKSAARRSISNRAPALTMRQGKSTVFTRG